jgi:hypothetical protein
MARITRIEVEINTGKPGTNGGVWLGLCGREFRLNNPGVNDLKENSITTFILGDGSTVEYPAENDPRAPFQLWTEWMTAFPNFPRYIRFRGGDAGSRWNIREVIVRVNPGQPSNLLYGSLTLPNDNLTLGARVGEMLYLLGG